MSNFVLKEIHNNDIESELQKIGFDDGYRLVAADKFRYKNIKIFNLTPAQANILKQTAISVGADCATHREVVTGKADLSNAIIGGSISQLIKISDKIKPQPFGFDVLSEKIKDLVNKKYKSDTKLVGILNITPDSFSDGGKYINPQDAQKHLIQLIQDGADIIDIGAESTKPYSDDVSANEQIERLKQILDFIQKENIKIPISIDTRSSIVADYALNNGASIINDVSGFDYDDKMPATVAKYKASVVIQHSKGTPQNMQDNPKYNDVVEEIFLNLKRKAEYAENLGINNIILDPGIGFGKTKADNFEILNRIEEFSSLDRPIMVGVSRKSFLDVKEDNNDLKDSLTLAVSYPLIQKSVDYLRVHNVKLHKTLLNCLGV